MSNVSEDGLSDEITLSFEHCPACGRAHYLPLIFQRVAGTCTFVGQCTYTLLPIFIDMRNEERVYETYPGR